MPRYDYQCVSCSHEFELVQKFSEAGSGTCPKCSGNGRRVFHAVPVIYKGSGFYTTDYGRPKSPPPEKSEKSDKKETATASKSTENGKSSGAGPAKSAAPAASTTSSGSESSG